MPRRDYALSPAQRIDAREALHLLDGTGLTLAEAARRALHGRRALQRISVLDAVDKFVRTRLVNGKRSRTVDWYESKLKHLTAKFGDRKIDDVDRPALVEYLDGMELSAGSKAGLARAWRALWRWAMIASPPMVTIDATLGLRTIGPSNKGDAKFLTVAQVAKALAGAGPYRSGLALLLFGGVRPDELAGNSKPPLLWRHVNVAEKMIRIPAEIAKTNKPRIIEGIPDTLWQWLTPGDDDVSVCRGRTRQLVMRAKLALSLTIWPHDATRHTFATYALAYTGDAGKVATWLGHEGKPTLLHGSYRGLATKAEADKFFALRPPA